MQVVGLTPIGRATIVALELNRGRAVNTRAADIAVGRQRPDPNGAAALGTTHTTGEQSTAHQEEGNNHYYLPPFHTTGLHTCQPA